MGFAYFLLKTLEREGVALRASFAHFFFNYNTIKRTFRFFISKQKMGFAHFLLKTLEREGWPVAAPPRARARARVCVCVCVCVCMSRVLRAPTFAYDVYYLFFPLVRWCSEVLLSGRCDWLLNWAEKCKTSNFFYLNNKEGLEYRNRKYKEST